jgi:hypothetical protein
LRSKGSWNTKLRREESRRATCTEVVVSCYWR